ncbi:hypothetical protein BCR33DRAFT_769175 [Rhizoclosmatium globosum]|uniref:Mitochondrial distribution and morphology protein 10 n=1 Tax=Rhizoclosmatium globosum TaxID=329046 RepID=A0A1Y2BUK5_9FUNG|nr:hypothetical protein BCR33DRAFT_769175 [Rhizoclosmatium globosum]|eukprot:ORY38354.1 hypothetical protein BCR33DRAFT_769175 [Rhizoclosmatium globosum]
MKDFLGQTLRQCFSGLGFSSEREEEGAGLYADMCSSSNSVLLFAPPASVSLAIGKCITPHLKSAYTLGLPNSRSAGFLFSSLNMDDSDDADNPDIMRTNLFAREVVAPTALPVYASDSVDHTTPVPHPTSRTNYFNSLMYGRLFEDFRLEALVAQQLGKQNLLVISGISAWDSTAHSHLEAQYIHKTQGYCADLTYSSTDNVFGTSCLFRVPYTNWSAGGEVIYTAAEKSGGLSLGAKWVKVHEKGVASILTFLCNPMMGYMNTTYTSTIRPNWVMSTSYDFNTYSYNSDLAVGVAYSPLEAENRLLKCRFSMTKGLALLLEGQFKRAIVGLGVTTNLGLGSSIRQSIGVEIQFI